MCYFVIQKCDGMHSVHAVNVEQSFRTPSNPPCCAFVSPPLLAHLTAEELANRKQVKP